MTSSSSDCQVDSNAYHFVLAMVSSSLPSFELGIITKYSIFHEVAEELSSKGSCIAEAKHLKNLLSKRISKYSYQECDAIFSQVFKDYSSESSKRVAKMNVRRLSGDCQTDETEKLSAKVYGEVDMSSFCYLLERVEINNGDTLYDLGHGTGKAMVLIMICNQIIMPFYSKI